MPSNMLARLPLPRIAATTPARRACSSRARPPPSLAAAQPLRSFLGRGSVPRRPTPLPRCWAMPPVYWPAVASGVAFTGAWVAWTGGRTPVDSLRDSISGAVGRGAVWGGVGAVPVGDYVPQRPTPPAPPGWPCRVRWGGSSRAAGRERFSRPPPLAARPPAATRQPPAALSPTFSRLLLRPGPHPYRRLELPAVAHARAAARRRGRGAAGAAARRAAAAAGAHVGAAHPLKPPRWCALPSPLHVRAAAAPRHSFPHASTTQLPARFGFHPAHMSFAAVFHRQSQSASAFSRNSTSHNYRRPPQPGYPVTPPAPQHAYAPSALLCPPPLSPAALPRRRPRPPRRLFPLPAPPRHSGRPPICVPSLTPLYP